MSKLNVYKDIICLEVRSPHGSKWWWQNENLSYTPCHKNWLQKIVWATVQGKGKVLATPVDFGNGDTVLVAVNVPRSDPQVLNAFVKNKQFPTVSNYTQPPYNILAR